MLVRVPDGLQPVHFVAATDKLLESLWEVPRRRQRPFGNVCGMRDWVQDVCVKKVPRELVVLIKGGQKQCGVEMKQQGQRRRRQRIFQSVTRWRRGQRYRGLDELLVDDSRPSFPLFL